MTLSLNFTSTEDLRSSASSTSTIFLSIILVWIAKRAITSYRKLPLPPGPKGYPIIGNVLNRPLENEWKTYYQWSKEYNSDVVATKLFSDTFIILNTLDAVNDLLDKRSADYAGRPQLESSILTGVTEWDVAVLEYGDFWKQCRKIMHQEIAGPAMSKLYHAHELKATHELLRRILRNPQQWSNHVKHFTGEMLISIAYGIDVLPENDPWIEAAQFQMDAGIQTVTPPYYVDFFPPLKHLPSWFPGAGFKQHMQIIYDQGMEMVKKPIRELKEKMETNQVHRPSFVSRSLSRDDPSDRDPLYDASLGAAAASIYAAGTDTTKSAISTVILALVSNPAALRAAQAQIDSVIGRDRLPDISDKESLPWVTAIMWEGLRWNPVAPIAVPHLASVDDEYRGFHIPAGAYVVPNAWGIFHDEKTYPDPFTFKPERFLGGDGNIRTDVKDIPTIAFGYGRRVCPGKDIAQPAVWTVTANIIAAFNISKAKDKNGQIIEPSYAYGSDMTSMPEPFDCSITPRDEHARRLIEATAHMEYDMN